MNIQNGNVNNSSQISKKQTCVNCSDSSYDRAELMKNIQALSFAKTETELYLDTHPEAMAALSYYKELIEKLAMITEEYEAKYGPLTAASVNGDRWTWVDGAWPWQYGVEEGV